MGSLTWVTHRDLPWRNNIRYRRKTSTHSDDDAIGAPHHVMIARARSPAGLEQPEGSLRFGADALLLAAFVTRHLEAKKHRYAAGGSLARSPGLTPVPVAELGSGCGAALLALALRCPQVAGLGLEREDRWYKRSAQSSPLVLPVKWAPPRMNVCNDRGREDRVT